MWGQKKAVVEVSVAEVDCKDQVLVDLVVLLVVVREAETGIVANEETLALEGRNSRVVGDRMVGNQDQAQIDLAEVRIHGQTEADGSNHQIVDLVRTQVEDERGTLRVIVDQGMMEDRGLARQVERHSRCVRVSTSNKCFGEKRFSEDLIRRKATEISTQVCAFGTGL